MTLTGNILITGNGTLTRAILRQAKAEAWDATFTIFSRNETRLDATRRRWGVRTLIGDVRDAQAVSAAIAGHAVVIHGAAMKRIPECEQQPAECVATNVQGSLNVARACQAHGVKLAIGISTDKACRASTAYGASKLMLEAIWRNQPASDTTFVAVRYGNVVASNGSVIPIWREQAQGGKLLSITDTRMTRFWMSPADAVTLIVKAAAGHNGDVWIPKMGGLPLVRMAEILCPGAKVAETGLRSAEKLHEDLVAQDEPATETAEHFILRKLGTLGHSYDSYRCPHLTPAAFLSMLHDAEDLEARR